MKRASLISVLVLAAFAGIAAATCCTTRVSGPFAYAPTYTHGTCLTGYYVGNYGGDITLQADERYESDRPTTTTAELIRTTQSMDFVVTNKGGPVPLNCGCTLQASSWPATMTCACQSGSTYRSRYSATYVGICGIASTLTVSATSTTSTCP